MDNCWKNDWKPQNRNRRKVSPVKLFEPRVAHNFPSVHYGQFRGQAFTFGKWGQLSAVRAVTHNPCKRIMDNCWTVEESARAGSHFGPKCIHLGPENATHLLTKVKNLKIFGYPAHRFAVEIFNFGEKKSFTGETYWVASCPQFSLVHYSQL